MASSLGSRGLAMFANLQTRPQCHITNKKDHKETIQSAGLSQFVFAKDCENLELDINGKVAKVTLECVNHAKITVNGKVVGGTLEIIRSTNVAIHFGKDAEIPIIQADNSNHVTINIHNKTQLQSVYYMRTHDIKLILASEQGDLEFDFSPDNESESQMQRVGEWSDSSPDAYFVTKTSTIQDGFDKSKVRSDADSGGQEITIVKPDNDVTASSKSDADKHLDDVD